MDIVFIVLLCKHAFSILE